MLGFTELRCWHKYVRNLTVPIRVIYFCCTLFKDKGQDVGPSLFFQPALWLKANCLKFLGFSFLTGKLSKLNDVITHISTGFNDLKFFLMSMSVHTAYILERPWRQEEGIEPLSWIAAWHGCWEPNSFGIAANILNC